jgi:putative transposase
LVQKSAYLLELSRYVILNPVRAGMVADAGNWPWSSYGVVVGTARAPDWLDSDWLLSQFGEWRQTAVHAYVHFVQAGVGQAGPWEQLRHQVFLGDDAFVERFHDVKRPEQLREIPKGQRRALAKPLDEYRSSCPERNEAMARAYGSGAYTMKEIGDFFGVHYMTVSRAVRRFEEQAAKLELIGED